MQRTIHTPNGEAFDAFLLEELKILKKSERELARLWPRLRLRPQLRDYFLLELTAVNQRADRLDAVLEPSRIRQAPVPLHPLS